MPFLGNFIPTYISVSRETIGIGALLKRTDDRLTILFVEGVAIEGVTRLILTPIGLAAINTHRSTVLTIGGDAFLVEIVGK